MKIDLRDVVGQILDDIVDAASPVEGYCYFDIQDLDEAAVPESLWHAVAEWVVADLQRAWMFALLPQSMSQAASTT